MAVLKLGSRLLGLLSTVFLARLLTPEDFGVVAIATLTIALVEVVTLWTFEAALIRTRFATEDHYKSYFTINVLIGVFFGVLLIVFSGPLAIFFGIPELESVYLVVGIAQIVLGFENPRVVDLRKELRFKTELSYRISLRLFSVIVTIAAAYILQSYWAMIIGLLTLQLARVASSYIVVSPTIGFSVSKFSEMIVFSRWLVLSNAMYFVRARLPEFLIGRLYNAEDLGSYRMSKDLATVLTEEVSTPVKQALFPALAKSSSRTSTADLYITLVCLTAMLVLPISAFVFQAGDLLIEIVLGPKWVASSTFFVALCGIGAFNALTSIGVTTLVGMGSVARATVLSVIYTLAIVGSAVFGLAHSLDHMLTLFGWCALGYLIINVAVVSQFLRIPITRSLRAVGVPIATSLFVGLFVSLLRSSEFSESYGLVEFMVAASVASLILVLLAVFAAMRMRWVDPSVRGFVESFWPLG